MSSGESNIIFACFSFKGSEIIASKLYPVQWKYGRLSCWSRAESTKAVPLTCHGHSRPVTHLSFSSVVDDDQYYLISACKGLDPADCLFWMILMSKRQQPHASRWRYWWLVSGQSRWITGKQSTDAFRIGTFIGHKGAVWQSRLSMDATLAATAAADFTAYWPISLIHTIHKLSQDFLVKYGTPILANVFTPSHMPTLFER